MGGDKNRTVSGFFFSHQVSLVMTCAVSFCFLLLSTAMLEFAHAADHFQQPTPVHLDQKGERWARESLKKMSLEQKIGQMFMIWSQAQFMNVDSPEYIRLRDTMRKYHLGGFGLTVRFEDGFLYKNEPLEAAMVTNQLQRDSEFPLIFAADFERGLGFRLNDVTSFPHPMAFGATGNVEFARQAGRITAQESRAIGVQWNWFPIADVNSNPANPIINTRSFGEDPKQVGEMVAAYIEGAHEFGMLTTAKHFPGHGDTDADSRGHQSGGGCDHGGPHPGAGARPFARSRGLYFPRHRDWTVEAADGFYGTGRNRRDGHERADHNISRRRLCGSGQGGGGSGEGR